MEYAIRKVRPGDLAAVTAVEADCFPAAEAAGREMLRQRIETFPDSFFVAETTDGKLIGFINGCVTDERTIRDEMFEDAGAHRPVGAYQSVFGLDVLEAYRRGGVAAALMGHMIEEARASGRRGVILTCKEELIPYYQKFGFQNMGLSLSVHGGAVWYDMILAW